MQGLSGKNVLITGGTSGIGQAIAVRFAGEGANVAVNYRKTPEDAKDTDEKVQECIAQVDMHGVKHVLVQGDVSREDQVKEMFREILQHIPLGRAGIADEMGAAATFLASDDASYITGQTLYVDGGLTLYPDFRSDWSSEFSCYLH